MRWFLFFRILLLSLLLLLLFSKQKIDAATEYLYDCANRVIQNGRWISGGGQAGSCNGKDWPVNNVDCSTPATGQQTLRSGNDCANAEQVYYTTTTNDPLYNPNLQVTCKDYCSTVNGTNICEHDSGINVTCKTPLAICQGDLSRFCLTYATPTPTPTPVPPTATTAPAPTPTPTPTTTPAVVTVQGRNVDVNGNALTVNIGQTITLSNGLTSNNLGAWNFSRIDPGDYTVTATIPTGYAVSYSSCLNTTTLPNGTTCHTTYTSGSSLTVNLSNGGNYADIYFKYTPNYISGNVYYDNDKDGIYDRTKGDAPYDGTVQGSAYISIPKGFSTDVYSIGSNGSYSSSPTTYTTGQNYTVTLSSIPSNYSVPTANNPVSFTMPASNKTVNFPLQQIPTPTPVPPTATTAPTPTAVPGAKVTVQGRNVDMDGNPLTVNIGQSISLLSNSGVSLTNNSIGAWDFSQIAPDGFRITAAIPAGYTVSYKYFQKNESPPTGDYIPGNSLTTALAKNNDYADIYFKYTPICTVTTSPAAHNLNIRGMGTVTASVTSGLGSATVSKMRFGSYNGTVASVPAPTSPDTEYTDRTDPYEAQTTANAAGSTAVWGTADLSDGRTCQSTGTTDTDINVAGPTPTPIPPTPTPASSGETCSVPDGVQGTCFGDWYCMGGFCVPRPTLAPEPTPASIYFIFGKIFNDVNGNGLSAGEANYTGAVTIATGKCVGNNCASTTGNYPVSRNGENYYFSNLAAGQYKVTFSGLPANWSFTYPPSIFGTNSLIVTVGAGCSAPAPAACCTGSCTLASQNSVVFLDAGVTTTKDAWIQSVGSDIRWDKEFGFTNPLPSANTYTSIPGTGGMPGIIFSGGKEGLSPNFGANNGQASPNPFNWQVGKYPNIEVFTQSHSLIPTSYRFLLETAERSDIPKKKLLDLCENNVSSNCVLNPSMIHGFYWINEDLALNGTGYTFPSNQNFVILVNGNLRINEKIRVPDGSTVIFSVKGNIMVDKAIGEGAVSNCNAITHNGCSIEGLYSADNNFEAEGTNDCSVGADLRLNIAGTVVANAGRQGGTFVNNRTLCANNSSYPSVTFTQRPDFILNYPSLAKQNPRSWQEVAP